ncbi:YibE/F family protein [Actinomycetospora cinnamomea]|uniref:YibE/F family protein n=1 Tax=Actinomycetospora cinnamomea TaxID=663609 RepID=UPI001FAEB875|nr:YibE/F family protein [Actinomycetospora cinnamomea]
MTAPRRPDRRAGTPAPDDDTGPIRRERPREGTRRRSAEDGRPDGATGRRRTGEDGAPSRARSSGTAPRRRRSREASAREGSPPRRAADPGAEVAVGHGHGHGGGGLEGASAQRVRRLLALLLAPFVLAVLAGLVLLMPSPGDYARVVEAGRAGQSAQGVPGLGGQTPVDGEVLRAAGEVDCTDPNLPAPAPGEGCVAVTVRLDSGPAPGTRIATLAPSTPGSPRFAVGDPVVLAWSGGDPADPLGYTLVDFQRGPPLLLLGGLFALAVVLLGRWQGLRALVALGVTLGVLAVFVLPALATGASPVPVALIACGLIVGVVLPLTHGASARSATAALGTLASLALIGVLALLFAAASRLTGLGEEASELAGVLGPGLDVRGLLLAGVIIGALGVLDDVTVTQTSAVWELHRADPAARLIDLYGSAMRVGRDHVASAVNTLVLAYAGAALPLLLLFALAGRGLGDLLTAEDVAQEVVRTLVGSIGLVASVPVTTFLAAVVVRAVSSSSPSTRGEPA